MMVRALICCTALVLGLLAMLSATAQSAGTCNGADCRQSGKARPLDLMSFMHGRPKGDAKAARPSPARNAAHSSRKRDASRATAQTEPQPEAAPEAQPAPAPATVAYTAEPVDVQVVSGDQLNIIDLAMVPAPVETIGAAPKAENTGKTREAALKQDQPAAPAAAPVRAAQAPGEEPRDDSFIGRFWAKIGDGFLALVTMVRQLFA